MISTQSVVRDAQTLVIKIGTALIVDESGLSVRQSWLNALAADVAAYQAQGKKIVIVSSGAVALGRTPLGIALETPPQSIPLEKKQASSAIGQFHVFNGFHTAFQAHNIALAQVLLTMSETENRAMHLNARATLSELLSNNVIPIINENDTISTGEIRFGDNDRLAARVAQMIEADAVLLLSTTDGLYTDNPDTNIEAEHIPVVKAINNEHVKMAGDAVPGMSTGGMKSKVEAAKLATSCGIHLIVANGKEDHIFQSVLSDASIRTSLFVGGKQKRNARKRWIGSHMSPKGSVTIDDGAVQALKNGKSLLPVGVVDVEGGFMRGDIIQVLDHHGHALGMGVSAYSAEDTRMIMGQNKDLVHTLQGYVGRDELIHRNDLVLVNSAA